MASLPGRTVENDIGNGKCETIGVDVARNPTLTDDFDKKGKPHRGQVDIIILVSKALCYGVPKRWM